MISRAKRPRDFCRTAKLAIDVASTRKLIAVVCFATVALISWLPAVAHPSSKDKPAALSLTSGERAEIWHSLSKQATKTSVPAGLHVGEVVPSTMRSRLFARDIRKKVPAIRSYSYALLHNQVLIIAPRSKKIVFIVAK
jgi:hypothetical protein